MIENTFRRKLSAIVLSAIIAASAVSAALPSAQEALAADNSTSVSDNADDNTDSGE